MNVLMMTNTYLPIVGGVSRSVDTYSEALRRRGHRVLVVAPAHDEAPEEEPGVVRVPATSSFSSNESPVRLPIPGYLSSTVRAFRPDIVHAHHPFFLGATGLRVAAPRNLPVVFTHHTMYEHFTHYVPVDREALGRFTVRLATEFANLCDRVIAPSRSVERVLRERGVTRPITVLPTGIDTGAFARGDGRAARQRHDIPPQAFVVGHVGRLALEKNLVFLAEAVALFLRKRAEAYFFVVGNGAAREDIQAVCERAGVADRLRMSDGELSGKELADAYRAMDLFAFASQSDTQGMVLAEAMSAGMPVVAVDAPGARDIIRDRVNGRLLREENVRRFAGAIDWVATAEPEVRAALRQAALKTAAEFSIDRCVERLYGVYRAAQASHYQKDRSRGVIGRLSRRIGVEYHLWGNVASALYDAAAGESHTLRPKQMM